jgi:hypothetical protein
MKNYKRNIEIQTAQRPKYFSTHQTVQKLTKISKKKQKNDCFLCPFPPKTQKSYFLNSHPPQKHQQKPKKQPHHPNPKNTNPQTAQKLTNP